MRTQKYALPKNVTRASRSVLAGPDCTDREARVTLTDGLMVAVRFQPPDNPGCIGFGSTCAAAGSTPLPGKSQGNSTVNGTALSNVILASRQSAKPLVPNDYYWLQENCLRLRKLEGRQYHVEQCADKFADDISYPRGMN